MVTARRVESKRGTDDARIEDPADVPPRSQPAFDSTRIRILEVLLRLVRIGPVLVLVTLVLLFWLSAPRFLSLVNVQNLMVQGSVVTVLAIGELLVILTGGIDLSIGAAMSLATVLGALAFQSSHGSSGIVVVAMMLLVGIAVGLVNGGLLVWGRMPHPLIATLATMAVASGIALTASGGQPISGVPDLVNTLGNTNFGVVPVPAIVAAATAALAYVLTRRMQWGRWIYATGGNPEAAKRVGMPVRSVLLSVYALSGLCAGIAAILTAGLIGGGDSGLGPAQGGLLDAIAGVIIGGASLIGGRGTVVNAVVGAMIVVVIRNGLAIINVSPFSESIYVGLTIAVAVELDVIRTSVEKRIRAMRSLEVSR